MAVIDSKGYVRGIVGPTVFRRAWGKNIAQARPRKFKQTAASIESSSEFGLISSAGAAIRHAFAPAIRYYDGGAVGRTTSAVSRSVRGSVGTLRAQRDLHDGDLSQLVGLEFNCNSPLQDVLRLRTEVNRNECGQVQVQLPALKMSRDLRLPDALRGRIYRVQVRFLLIGFNFRENYYEYIDHRDVDYHWGEEAAGQTVTFEGDVPKGCMQLLSMSISLYESQSFGKEDALLNSLAFSPCALIGAWQSAQVIALNEARPPEEVRNGRFYMGYSGNEILAALASKIKRRAKAVAGQPPGQYAKAGRFIRRSKDGPDDMELLKGKRVAMTGKLK